MRGKITVLTICAMLYALCLPAKAQQPGKISRIGTLVVPPPPAVATRLDAFRQRLRELGYVEGSSFVIESRSAEGKLERIPALAAELVHLKVDVIVSGGPATTRPAIEATKAIPIVMGQDDDPVGNGFVASLARPGGNVTGLSSLAPEISGKRLELLKEITPSLSRVAILGSSTMPGNSLVLRETEFAANALKIQVQYQDVRASAISNPPSRRQASGALRLSLCWEVRSSIRIEKRSLISASSTDLPRHIMFRNSSKPAV